uniref:protein N-terminal methyltransferase n=1 Tax=Eptatretus burgeri TaxID=7764 RepID=A0A8C4R4S1_EPTBU
MDDLCDAARKKNNKKTTTKKKTTKACKNVVVLHLEVVQVCRVPICNNRLDRLRETSKPTTFTGCFVMTDSILEDNVAFYSDGAAYWRGRPATVDAMLGGYGHISGLDVCASRKFLSQFLGEGPGKTGQTRALDCGSGIGRITKRLLLPLFDRVDMVDVTETFLKRAPAYLGAEAQRVDNYYCSGLQDFIPMPGHYDLIWIQWVIGHLTDEHLTEFLKRSCAALRPGGLICIKDNVAQEGVIWDGEDSSVCRSLDLLSRIVEDAGMTILEQKCQDNFPKEIYAVWMIAMR